MLIIKHNKPTIQDINISSLKNGETYKFTNIETGETEYCIFIYDIVTSGKFYSINLTKKIITELNLKSKSKLLGVQLVDLIVSEKD